jgi:hypothetical protein
VDLIPSFSPHHAQTPKACCSNHEMIRVIIRSKLKKIRDFKNLFKFLFKLMLSPLQMFRISAKSQNAQHDKTARC